MAQVTKRFDVVAARKYTNNKTGEEKTHWINVGQGTEWDGDGISLDVHALPCFPGWDGRLRLFEAKPKDQRQSKPAQSEQDLNDDIPW